MSTPPVMALAPGATLGSCTRDVRPNNLPALSTALIGREGLLESALAMLRQPGVRLVTLTGPGGVGKTRLGLQIAADLVDEMEDGAWFVALAPIRDAGLVASTIAATLGLAESRELTMASVLEHHLRDKKTLLVLDNLEQVIDAAPLVAPLVAATSHLKILVTSRTLLHVSGEHNVAVPPLAPTEAVRLFLERARALKTDFRVTEEILPEITAVCQHLDGLPLAIELAAARVRVLSPKALRARLVAASLDLLTGGARDLPARHRTLRATIAWSFDLLDDREKSLFRRLGVFARGAPLAAIEAIAGDVGTLDVVGSLVDKSILVQDDSADEPRFSMLETLREFAIAELDTTGEGDELRAKHATWYLALAEEASRDVGRQRSWLGRLEAEHDNMRGAITWALGRGDAELALRLTAALAAMWRLRGHAVEGRRAIDAALALPGGTPRARAGALVGAALLTRELGDLRDARVYAESALTIERTLNDRRGLADALDGLIWVAIYQGDVARGRAAVDEYLALAKELGSKRDLAIATAHSASIASEEGRGDTEPKIAEALALFRAIGDEVSTAYSLNQLGELVRARGDHRGALALYESSLALARELDARRWINIVVVNVGITLVCLGEHERARAVLAESLVMTRAMRALRPIPPTLSAVARIALVDGDATTAARLLGAAEAMLEAEGATALYADRAEQEAATGLIVERLGATAAKVERQSGRALSTDAALAAALAVLKLGMGKVAAHPEAMPGAAPPRLRSPVAPSVLALTRDGATWTLALDGRRITVRDGKGVRYLEALLAAPHREIHVLELVGVDHESNAGTVLDAQARRAYRDRIEALRDQLEESTARNDWNRAERARGELDALASELARAVGLGGRARRAGSLAERARINIQRRLRALIGQVAGLDAALGRHLELSVRTGLFCMYAPTWP